MTELPATATGTKPNKPSSLCESLLAHIANVRQQVLEELIDTTNALLKDKLDKLMIRF